MSDDERLKTLYANRASPEGHPREEAWEALLCEELAADERKRVLEHVVRCMECAGTYRALLQVTREARAFDPGALRVPRSIVPARRLLPLLALAAGLAAM